MKILFVEDDDYKAEDIRQVILKCLTCSIKVTQSVADSVDAVFSDGFDLVILDMALPSFSKSDRSQSGPSKLQGGVEILKTLNRLKSKAKVIIISQYPSIEIDGHFVDLQESKNALCKKYDLQILKPILYEHNSTGWVTSLETELGNL